MSDIQCLRTGILGVNTYIVPCELLSKETRDYFVVDPGGHPEKIAEQIRILEGSLVGIILTHGHFDHVGALAGLKELYPNAIVCIHSADDEYVGKNGYDTHRDRFSKIGFYQDDFFTHDVMPGVDEFLEDKKTLSFAPEWKVIHTPGHTEGSVCIYNENKDILLSGDTLFKMAYGRTDLPGGSFSKLKVSLEKLFNLPDTTVVYPGHEGYTTIGQEKNIHL